VDLRKKVGSRYFSRRAARFPFGSFGHPGTVPAAKRAPRNRTRGIYGFCFFFFFFFSAPPPPPGSRKGRGPAFAMRLSRPAIGRAGAGRAAARAGTPALAARVGGGGTKAYPPRGDRVGTPPTSGGKPRWRSGATVALRCRLALHGAAPRVVDELLLGSRSFFWRDTVSRRWKWKTSGRGGLGPINRRGEVDDRFFPPLRSRSPWTKSSAGAAARRQPRRFLLGFCAGIPGLRCTASVTSNLRRTESEGGFRNQCFYEGDVIGQKYVPPLPLLDRRPSHESRGPGRGQANNLNWGVAMGIGSAGRHSSGNCGTAPCKLLSVRGAGRPGAKPRDSSFG